MADSSASPPQTRAYARRKHRSRRRCATIALPARAAVDIPQFAVVKTNVASGQQPFAGGIAWLKAHGYRTVLHVRSPAEDDSAARKQFEQSGLRVPEPGSLAANALGAVVDQFNRLVGDANNQPLFVYDQDGAWPSPMVLALPPGGGGQRGEGGKKLHGSASSRRAAKSISKCGWRCRIC